MAKTMPPAPLSKAPIKTAAPKGTSPSPVSPVLAAPKYVDREAKFAQYTPSSGTLVSPHLTNDKTAMKGDPTNPVGAAKPAKPVMAMKKGK